MRELTAVAAIGFLVMAGCVDDRDATGSTPTAEEDLSILRGAYATETRVVDTDIPGESAGDGAEMEMYFTCLDSACHEVLQRSTADPDTRFGKTVRLRFDEDDEVWRGEVSTEVACPEGGRIATDELVWQWSSIGKGRFAGVIEQDRVGCDENKISARTNLDARVDPMVSLPYLGGADAATVKAALSSYDGVIATVYERLPACRSQLDDPATLDRGVACLLPLLSTWRPAGESVATVLAPLRPKAEPDCRAALGEVDHQPVATAIDETAEALGEAKETGSLDGAVITELIGVNGEFEESLVQSARLCVAPDELDGLGSGNSLVFDVHRAVFPGQAPTKVVGPTTSTTADD